MGSVLVGSVYLSCILFYCGFNDGNFENSMCYVLMDMRYS